MDTKLLLGLLCLMVLALAVAGPAGALSAGAARVDITPPLDRFPTVSLGGFGDRNGKPATSVHDPIFARALVLKDGDTKVALVSTDLLVLAPGFKGEVARRVRELGFRSMDLLLAATHSHSAPECMHPGGDAWPLAFGKFHPDLYRWTADRVAEAIRQADRALQPAQASFAAGHLPGLNRNRRKTGNELVDDEMTVLRIAAAGRPLAMVVNWAAHPTIMGGSSFAYSGEYPGALSRSLEERLGEGGVALFFNGPQGDQSVGGDFGSGWEKVAAYGKRLADEAWRLAGMAKPAEACLAVSDLTWQLPPYQVSPVFVEDTGEEYQMTPEKAAALFGRLFPSRVEMQAIRVGPAVFLAYPCEPIAELGLAMKARVRQLGGRYPIGIALANSYIGYVLTPEQYKMGGYESGTSFYGPQLGVELVREMARAVQPLLQ